LAVVVLAVVSASSATAARLITGADVKDSSLTGRDVKRSSLTGDDIANRSLRARDLRGLSDVTTTLTVHESEVTTLPATAGLATADALCPRRQRVIAGGYFAAEGTTAPYAPIADGAFYDDDRKRFGWSMTAVNLDYTLGVAVEGKLIAVAYCAPVVGASRASLAQEKRRLAGARSEQRALAERLRFEPSTP
jgi:hypothetical protein